ncbi:MAG: formylglycine-generating enzyme family protein [Nodosilinea sp.]
MQSQSSQVAQAPEQFTIIRQPHRAQCFTEPAIQLDLLLIPGGTFTMGSPPDELGRYNDEGPQHEVTVPTFLMGRYPVTQAQWRAVATRTDLKVNTDLDPDPANFKGDNRPVEQVAWHDAVEFCDRLSRLTSHTYRLPTEAEWEYACRAGTETPFHFGETITTDLANYRGEDREDDPEKFPGHYGNGPKGIYRKETTPVNYFHPLANAFGLCDLHGNVREWCLDHWHDNYDGAPIDGSAWLTDDKNARRLLRGGSWDGAPGYCRSASRTLNYPDYRGNDYGFRVICEARGL